MTAVMTVTLMTIMIANNDYGDIEMMALDGSDGCEGLIGVSALLPASFNLNLDLGQGGCDHHHHNCNDHHDHYNHYKSL